MTPLTCNFRVLTFKCVTWHLLKSLAQEVLMSELSGLNDDENKTF